MSRPITKDSFAARNLRSRLEATVVADELDLPLLPESAQQVLAACNSDECDAHELSKIIVRDPALASHVLRVANSVAYAPEEPIVSLQQAASRLGQGTLCGIAISIVARSEVFDLPGYEQRLQNLWHHSSLTAAWASEVARLRRRNVEAAFLSGLLHDIGTPVVFTAISAMEALATMRLGEDVVDDWVDEFHAPVGARLLETWGLPPRVCATAQHHHDPAEAEEYGDEVRMVCLADLLAQISSGEATIDEVRAHPVLASLGIYPDELDDLLAQEDKVQAHAKVFL